MVLLIWDFEVDTVLSATCTALPPHYPDCVDETLRICPLLDVSKPTCNCSNFPITGKVLVDIKDYFVPETQLPPISDDELMHELDELQDLNLNEVEDVLEEVSTDDLDDEQFSEMFLLKGSSYHKHFQDALRSCKQSLLNGDSKELRVRQEPVNKKDENAIVVEALFVGSWEPIGYIPATKVPKTMDAICKNEITVVALDNVIYRYVFGIGCHRYFAKVLITKRMRWLPNNRAYHYNDQI